MEEPCPEHNDDKRRSNQHEGDEGTASHSIEWEKAGDVKVSKEGVPIEDTSSTTYGRFLQQLRENRRRPDR